MRLIAAFLLGFLAATAPVRADDAIDDACLNEIRLLCPDMGKAATRRCLKEYSGVLLPECRDQLSRPLPDNPTRLREARLVGAAGAVFLHLAGRPEEEYVEVSSGTPLSVGDSLRVGAAGAAELAVDGATLVSLSSGTEIAVTALAAASTELRLAFGSLAAKIESLRSGERFRVATPTLVAAVRGTELVVEEDGSGEESRVGVIDEGRVEVSAVSGGEPVVLGPRQETAVRRGRPPELPRALERLRPRAENFAAVRTQAANSVRNWQPLSPTQGAAIRARLAERRPVVPGAMGPRAGRGTPAQGGRGGPSGAHNGPHQRQGSSFPNRPSSPRHGGGEPGAFPRREHGRRNQNGPSSPRHSGEGGGQSRPGPGQSGPGQSGPGQNNPPPGGNPGGGPGGNPGGGPGGPPGGRR